MEIIKKHFDEFVFNTRIMPVLIAGTPFFVFVIYRGIISSDWLEASINLSLTIIMLTFFGYIAREWGKNYEEKMYEELGGMPTTIILRFSDDKIDNISKLKYHKLFNYLIPDVAFPLSLTEEQTDHNSDEKYISAMRFLRVHANSNRDKYPRVYQELKKYNLWRNLYGCKSLFVISYMVLIIRECMAIEEFSFKEIFMTQSTKYVAFFGLLAWTSVFCVMVTKKTVKRNAFDYAKTLLEILEKVSQE